MTDGAANPAGSVPSGDLGARLAFLLEADRLKTIERMTTLIDGSRRENTAEHSWHLALFALVLHGSADEPVDLLRVLTLVLVHDLVEIDAGDTFAYDDAGYATKAQREQTAADRLFGILPALDGAGLRAAWEEFEHGDTPEGRFARALDRLQPVLLNHARGGGPWREHGISEERVVARNAPIADGSRELWAEARRRIGELAADGRLG